MSLTYYKFGKCVVLLYIFAATLSACTPANVVVKPTPVIANTATTIPIATSAPLSENCKVIHEATICIQDIQTLTEKTDVTFKIQLPTKSVNADILSDDAQGLSFVIKDDKGHVYALTGKDGFVEFESGGYIGYYRASFEPLAKDVKKLTISLPIVEVETQPKADGFQLDLGPNPQPGEIKTLDTTTLIDGQTFHFVKAAFEGANVDSLRVTIYTDPLNLPNEISYMTPIIGDPKKGFSFGSKFGVNGNPFRIFGDLVIPPGKSSGKTDNTYIKGIVNLQVVQVTYGYRGPFELQFTLP